MSASAKKLAFILTLIVLLAILFFTFRPSTVSKQVISTPPTHPTGTFCYSRSQAATKDAPYAVEEHIGITIAGDSVSGTKNGTQSGPDMSNGYEGVLSGVIHDDEIEATYAYTIEGAKNRELEVYTFSPDTLTKKRWELKDTIEDGEPILLPTKEGEPQLIRYTSVPCERLPVAPEPAPISANPAGECYVGGCSQELCSDQKDMISNCVYSPVYACYKTAKCERQTNGQCGWTQTSDLKACVSGNTI